jgi:putative spermidine/putrescine transport system ATP-binding protein
VAGVWLLRVSDIVVEIPGLRPPDARHRVVDGLCFDAPADAVVAVAGPPGFGGTTVARVITGLVVPHSGSVEIDGTDVTATLPADRPVAFVPAGGGLLPGRTASENIVYGLRLRNTASVLIRTRVADVVERLELQSSLDLRPHELSPGQRLRTALARAAIRNAAVLVVDATNGAQAIEQVRPMVERVRGDSGVTVVLCTNRPDLLDPADVVVWMARGAAVCARALRELQRAPGDLATAMAVYGPGLEVHQGVVSEGHLDCHGQRFAAPGTADGDRVCVVVPPLPHPAGSAFVYDAEGRLVTGRGGS